MSLTRDLARLHSDSDGNLILANNLTVDTNTLKVDAANNKVGIGTDTPSVNLEVSNSGNSFALVKNTSSGSGLYIKADTDGDTELQTAGGNNNIVIRTSGHERARFSSGGNVGIGQTNPDSKLHISATRPNIDVEDTAAGTRAKFGAGYANTYIATTSSGGEIFFKNGVGSSDFPHSSGTNLAIIGANASIKTYGNTFHIHAGQGTMSHANEFQFLTTEVVTGTSGSWYDVCYVSHSPNLRFHGLSVQDGNEVYRGGARYIGALMGTYGNVACYQEQKRVSAMNGGGVSDIDFRYLNSGASSGSYRLQVKLNFSSGAHRVYVCVYGNAVAELIKDGY
tara:strand:- start:270 stop:1280 length:1011 start_codon:yes stop_codon:yes gene_type:complete